jgi:HEAT repeat protein
MRPKMKLFLISLAAGAALFGQIRIARSRLTTGGTPAISDMITTGNISNAAQLLKSEYSFDKRGGLLALRRFSLLVLRQALKESDPYERCYAATALAAYGDWAGRGIIVQALDSPNQMIQKAVLEGLAEAHNSEALWILEQFYRSSSPIGRSLALQALVKVQDPIVMPILIDAAKDPNSSDAFWAATGLGYVRDSRALPHLRLLLAKSADPMIRVQAARSLILRGDRSKAAFLTVEQALHGEDVAEASGAALAMGDEQDPAMAPLLSQIESEERVSSEVQLAAAVALTHYGSGQGLPLLTAALADRRLRDFMLPMFVHLNFKLGRPLLLRAISSPDQRVRLAAMEAIGRNGGDPDAALLIGWINRANDPMDVAQIAWSLGQISGRNTIPALLDLVQNPAPAVRDTAADALAHTAGTLLSKPAPKGTEASASHATASE